MLKYIKSKGLRASVLPTVLVAGTLLLLAVMGIFMLWDMHAGQAARYHWTKQAQMHVESGFVLYAADGGEAERMLEEPVYRLYDDGGGSADLLTERYFWGLYEVVAIGTADGGASSVRMLGKAKPAHENPALWVCDRRKAVSFSGTTALFGEAWIPARGVQYSQMYSVAFKGRQLEPAQIRTSGEELPAIDPATRNVAEALWRLAEDTLSDGYLSAARSFREPLLCARVSGGHLDGDARGRVVIKGDDLIIGRECTLQDVLVVAASVRVESGFRGKVQIFARDSVVLEDNVLLEYPSGIFLDGDTPDGCLTLGDACEVNGYVIVEETTRPKGRPKARYIQPPGARVRGLLRVDGVAQVEGAVTGSAWLRESYYFTPRGYYSDIFYNARFIGADDFPYPVWHEGPYERMCVQWLY
ncbi:hypothetical protein LJC45_03230 [Alistipes sp. OttesenSCG-928-B03]|nr:hypothetical protein [Alistipes sp. OttesenSCG-928-B03]